MNTNIYNRTNPVRDNDLTGLDHRLTSMCVGVDHQSMTLPYIETTQAQLALIPVMLYQY